LGRHNCRTSGRIGQKEKQIMIKTIYILVGPQGAGKTYWCKNVLITDKRVTRISQDEQGKGGHMSLFMDYIQDGASLIVVDRMNFNREQRSRYIGPAMRQGYRIVIVLFKIDRATCLGRLATRKDHPTIPIDADHDKILDVYFNQFEPPEPDEYDELQEVVC